MYKMSPSSIAFILIIIQLAMSESYEEVKYKNVPQLLINGKTEVFRSDYGNQPIAQYLKFNNLLSNQLSSDTAMQAISRRILENNQNEIVGPLQTKSLTDESSKSICEGIYNKLNKMNALLGMLCRPQINTFSAFTHQRLARSILKREATCPMSKEKLVDDSNQLNEVISKASSESNTCDISELDSSNCIQWLRFIQCATDRLESGVKVAASTEDPIEQINKWDAVYKRIIYKYEQDAEVMREFFSNELKEEFDLLRAQLQATERVINDFKRESGNSTIKMCIENISNGSIENAVKYFKQVNKNSALIDITRVAYYDHGQLHNLKNIIDFGSALPTCSQNMIIYVTLYNLIKENNQLNSPHVMIFHKATNRCMKNSSIETSLTTRTQKIIELWSNSIRNSDYNDTLKFLTENRHAEGIRSYYPVIIERAYSHNLEHARNILNFIREIPYIEDECLCLSALFENMKNNNHLITNEVLMVANRLKEIMEGKNYPNVKEYFKNLAETLKNSFYSSVKNLIWDGVNCTIKSKDHDEFLYSPSNDWAYDSERRRVFTWRDKGLGAFNESYWSITPLSNADFFSIKNKQYNEYLYAAGAVFAEDSDRRNVFTWIPGTPVFQGLWTITPLDETGEFVINNKYHGEYFYAASNYWAEDSERRRVFTWRKDLEISSDMKWQIDCKSF